MKQIKSRSSICWPLLWQNAKIEIGFKRGLGHQQRHRKTKVQIVTIPWMRIFIRQATFVSDGDTERLWQTSTHTNNTIYSSAAVTSTTLNIKLRLRFG